MTTPQSTIQAFSDFFLTESTRPRGLGIYPEIFDSPCFPLQRSNELREMIRRVRTREPRIICELGSSRGGGLYHWCKCLLSVRRIIACDVGGIPYASQFEKAFPDIDFLWLPVSSHSTEALEKVEKWLANSYIDVLFLDGDKFNRAKDFDCYRPHMHDSSLLLIHDIHSTSGVSQKFFSEMQRKGYSTETILDTKESEEATKRQKEGLPPKNGYEGWLRHWKGQSAGVGVVRIEK